MIETGLIWDVNYFNWYNFYQVLHLAKHSETQGLLVVYQPEYGEREIWVRPLAMFDEMIEREGKPLKRFSKVEDIL